MAKMAASQEADENTRDGGYSDDLMSQKEDERNFTARNAWHLANLKDNGEKMKSLTLGLPDLNLGRYKITLSNTNV